MNEETAFGTRVRSGNLNRTAVGVEASVPVLVNEGSRGKKFSVGTIEHIKDAVAVGMEQKFAIFSAPHSIDEDHILRRIPVVTIVRRELEMPLPLPRIGIERDDRVCEKVVAVSSH